MKCATYYKKETITSPWTWTYNLNCYSDRASPIHAHPVFDDANNKTTAQIELHIATHTSPPVSLHWEVKEYTNMH